MVSDAEMRARQERLEELKKEMAREESAKIAEQKARGGK